MLFQDFWNPLGTHKMPKLSSIRLTDTYVKSLKPQANRYIVYDAALPGFGIRVAESGAKTWVVLTRLSGKRKRITIGRYPAVSLTAARETARQTMADIHHGRFETHQSDMMFVDALEEWYQREQRANKSFRQVEQAIRLHVVPYLKNKKLSDVSKSDLMKVIDRIADQGKTTQANRTRAFIKRFFSWALERDLLQASPAASLPKAGVEISRDRVLSRDELVSVWNAAGVIGYPFGPLLKLLILTAQRRDEVAQMRWSEIDLERTRWVISKERAKNGKAHVVHLSEAALSLIKSIPKHGDSDLVFTTTGTTPVSGFSVAKKNIDMLSKVSDWRLHDLRRTAATLMADDLGIAPAVVDRILNHVSGTVRGVAAIYQRGELLDARAQALNAFSQLVEKCCAEAPITQRTN